MLTTTETISNATIAARNDWVTYTLVQEKEIYAMLDQTASEITRAINVRAVAGKVPIPRLKGLLNEINAEMGRLRPALRGKIKTGIKNSIDYGIKTGIRGVEPILPKNLKLGVGSSFIGADGKIRRYNAVEEAYKQSTWYKINTYAMEALIRFEPAGETLSSRIWDMTRMSEKTIRNRVSMGVMQGESATRLSRDIRGYLVQPETLRGRVKAMHKPGPGVYKSAYKNSMRLARTEYARAYTEGTYRYGAHKTWIKGYISRRGSTIKCDICEDYAGEYFPKESPPPIPYHPICYCYAEIVIDETVIK